MSRHPRHTRPGAGQIAVDELPVGARLFAQLPYSSVTEVSRRYHLKVYTEWCLRNDVAPWPTNLERLLRFAAERANLVAYFTVREHVRIVSMIERNNSGNDFYAHPTMHRILEGIKREHPPEPVRPLRPKEVRTLFAFVPQTSSQRRTRTSMLLSYAAGFTLMEHARFRVEMATFADDGLWIDNLSEDRPLFFVGRGTDPQTCPVVALRSLIGDRAKGPMYTSVRGSGPERSTRYHSLPEEIRRYGKSCGLVLSNERIRLSGLIAQSKQIDMVRLAHFHGLRHIVDLAKTLDRYAPSNDRFKK